VVPALYAMWFRVRADEPAAVEHTDEFSQAELPPRIAAE
jgi:hypothetical protein